MRTGPRGDLASPRGPGPRQKPTSGEPRVRPGRGRTPGRAPARGANIFVVRDGRIKTPLLHSILDGITRNSVIEIARDRLHEVSESTLTRDDLYIADEIFLTGTAAELPPVREVDHRTIGEGRRGPVAEELQKTSFGAVTGADARYDRWRTLID